MCARGRALGAPTSLSGSALRGSVVLQIDELSDIANNYEERMKFADLPSRCLRLRLTDGVTSVAAIETVRISQLSVNTPPGAKLLLTDVPLSRRILLLTPANCRLLGGAVRALCDAQAAMRVADSNKGQSNARAIAPPPPTPILEIAARPLSRQPPPNLMTANDEDIVPDTPEEGAGFVRQFDDDFDMNAFLAAENEALHAQKRLRGNDNDAHVDGDVVDLGDDVDDLVRIVTQVPDSDVSEDEETSGGQRKETKSNAMTTTTTTRMIDLCDDDDDNDEDFA